MSKIEKGEVEALVELFNNSDWRELNFKSKDFQIFLSNDSNAVAPGQFAGQPASQTGAALESTTLVQPAALEAHPPPVAGAGSAIEVCAPNLGIFYSRPSPGDPPFVEPGVRVTKDSKVCLIEVMKLFTTLRAGVSGVVQKVCVKDGDIIEHGQVLFLIKPEE